MFTWLQNFGNWLSDIFTPFIDFFKSTIHGLTMMVKMFPLVSRLVANSIAYVPAIFATFITITLIIYIVYLIIGRNAGGSGGG